METGFSATRDGSLSNVFTFRDETHPLRRQCELREITLRLSPILLRVYRRIFLHYWELVMAERGREPSNNCSLVLLLNKHAVTNLVRLQIDVTSICVA